MPDPEFPIGSGSFLGSWGFSARFPLFHHDYVLRVINLFKERYTLAVVGTVEKWKTATFTHKLSYFNVDSWGLTNVNIGVL